MRSFGSCVFFPWPLTVGMYCFMITFYSPLKIAFVMDRLFLLVLIELFGGNDLGALLLQLM